MIIKHSKTLILVGNGLSLKAKNRGSLIDDFKAVVRMNNYVTKGFEKDCGSRTDIFCRRSTGDVQFCKAPDLKKVLNFVTYCRGTPSMEQQAKHISKLYKGKYLQIGKDFCKKIGEEAKLKQPQKEWCSVGILAIAYFCEVLPAPFYITGFDFVEGYHGKCKHYYPRAPSGDTGHNWEKEATYIKKKLNDGKIFLLTP